MGMLAPVTLHAQPAASFDRTGPGTDSGKVRWTLPRVLPSGVHVGHAGKKI